MTSKQLYIVLAVLAVGAYFIMGVNCHFDFKNEDEILQKLIIYGLMAMIIERFVNNFVVHDEYHTLKTQNDKDVQSEDHVEARKEHSKKFIVASQLISLLIAAMGFRLFKDIFTPASGCDNISMGLFIMNGSWLFNIVDIFLTSVMLAGGSTFVNSILLYLSRKTK